MLTVKIICIGKLKEKYLVDGIKEYEKRLKTMCKLEIIELPEYKLPDSPSDNEILKCITKEGEQISKKLTEKDFIIPLCIEGDLFSSEKLAKSFENIVVNGNSKISFIIGGSHGICDSIKSKGNIKMSMSKMTFPHQLARLMLLEQIYRAFNINMNTKYHK